MCDGFYNETITPFLMFRENIMGKTLHNKIPLGRSTIMDSRPLQALLVIAVFASIGLTWMALRTIN